MHMVSRLDRFRRNPDDLAELQDFLALGNGMQRDLVAAADLDPGRQTFRPCRRTGGDHLAGDAHVVGGVQDDDRRNGSGHGRAPWRNDVEVSGLVPAIAGSPHGYWAPLAVV
ncbi:hypothetical protein D3C72_2083170 [compost metagenome]